MTKSTEFRKSIHNATKSPCYFCMNYLAGDIKRRKSYSKDKRDILYYLNQISDPEIIKKITNLLKSMCQ